MSGARILIRDVGDGRLYVRWFCRDSALWRDILESFKACFPAHHDRSFSERTKTWSVPRWRYERLVAWIDEWFEPDEQEWLDEQPSGEYGRSYSRSGYSQYRRPQTSTSTIEAAFATLHLLPTAPPELVQAAHRTLVKIHHPDMAGGDGQTMVRINLALERIRAHHEEKAS